MPSSPSLLALLLFSLALCYSSSYVNGGGGGGGGEAQPRFHSVTLQSLQPSNTCSLIPPAGFDHGNRLPIVHRHGPCSPFSTDGKKIDYKQILEQDVDRANYLNRNRSVFKKKSNPRKLLNDVTIPNRKGNPLDTLNYIVTVGIGTPPQTFSVIFDTSMDASWIQCTACSANKGACYPQQDNLFDPSQSSTYANMSCKAEACIWAPREGCDDDRNCMFILELGDLTYTYGGYVEDTLTLTSSTVLNRFNFGCSKFSSGDFGTYAGMLGLSRHPASLASQASKVLGEGFSYCLPANDGEAGYLTIGAREEYPGVQFTRMLTDPNSPSSYLVELVGISVGGRRLPIPPTMFSKLGTIVDSGVAMSQLPRAAYTVLRDEFRALMRNYTMTSEWGWMDTCYDFTGVEGEISVPEVQLHFGGGVTVDVVPGGTMISMNPTQMCLAFQPTPAEGNQFTVIGNIQQRSIEVVYDIERMMIGFGSRSCN